MRNESRFRWWWACAAALIALLALGFIPGAFAEADGAGDTWTVLIYMCGSDMETKAGMATYNLHEIMQAPHPSHTVRYDAAAGGWADVDVRSRVNVLVETGGARKWQNAPNDGIDWGLEVAADRLQRYELSDAPMANGIYPLTLVDEQPQASMADPQTLTDFIRWGVRRCPAEKYMLVMWGHGGGSSSGLIIDQNYDNDILYLYELDQALAAADTRFEMFLLDACLMCSLETAQTLEPYGQFMVASEELSSGYGTAFREWMRELYLNPDCTALQMGCFMCDATQEKYSNMDDEQAEMQLTWSSIKLYHLNLVTAAFDRLFEVISAAYKDSPQRLYKCLNVLFRGPDKLGTGKEGMRDLGVQLSNDAYGEAMGLDVRNQLADALSEAVSYSVNGGFRAGSYGLSYCFPVKMGPEEMDIYARNCKSAVYLAFLDAMMSNWVAPDWVYEQTERLVPSEEIDFYNHLPSLVIEDGVPIIRGSLDESLLWGCHYDIYREDEETGALCRIGRDRAIYTVTEDGVYTYAMDDPFHWPMIDGVLCDIEYENRIEHNGYFVGDAELTLYNVPIQLGPDVTQLRVGHWEETDPVTGETEACYRVYGLAQRYNDSNRAPTRTVQPLTQLQGREYRLLYPVYTGEEGKENRRRYESSDPMTIYRTLDVEEMELPEGVYYCNYMLETSLRKVYWTELVKLYWDGSAFTVVE